MVEPQDRMSTTCPTPGVVLVSDKEARPPDIGGSSVRDGLTALASTDCMDARIRARFLDSLDLDRALREENPEENRWDYLLGLGEPLLLVGLEVHSAHTDQMSVVIDRRKAALRQLRPHLRRAKVVSRWLWVCSGSVDFDPYEKARRRLDENGTLFVGRRVLEKHLK